MSKTDKQTQAKPQAKAAAPSKNQPVLTERDLDQATGGICASGKHLPELKLTTG